MEDKKSYLNLRIRLIVVIPNIIIIGLLFLLPGPYIFLIFGFSTILQYIIIIRIVGKALKDKEEKIQEDLKCKTTLRKKPFEAVP